MPTTGRPRRPRPGPSGHTSKALEQGLGAGSEQPTRRISKRDEGPRTRSQGTNKRPFAFVVLKLALVLQV